MPPERDNHGDCPREFHVIGIDQRKVKLLRNNEKTTTERRCHGDAETEQMDIKTAIDYN